MMKKDSKGRNLRDNEDQMKDGRYRFRYIDENGERKAVYSWKLVSTDKIPSSAKECEPLREKEKKILKDLEDNIHLTEAMISVSELMDKYIETKVKLANSTKENYKHMINKNIRDSKFGNMPVKNVRKSDVQKYYAFLFNKKGFSEGTIQLYQNLIYPAFQLAVDDDLIRKNPCRGCMKDYSRGSMSSTRYALTREEQNALLEFVKYDTIYSVYYPLIALILSTGCRISEALGLTWNDINFTEKYISINHQILYRNKDGKCIYYASGTKTKEIRIIPIKDDLIEILKLHKANTYFMSMTSGFEVDGYKHFVFINAECRLRTPNTVVRAMHGIRDAYNRDREYEDVELPSFTPHTLRHTFCTRMAESGMDVKVLQELMGHKTIAVTMQVYNHVSNERTIREFKRMPSVLEA